MSDTHYSIHFKSQDALHKRGDVLFVGKSVLYIGQTAECGLQIIPHPDYADTCYAVIVRNESGDGWDIIRQDEHAEITINGMPLELASHLRDRDILKFDHTILRFNIEHGNPPATTYVTSKHNWAMWSVLIALFLIMTGVVMFLIENNKKPSSVFKHEIESICEIVADKLLVISSQNDTLEVIRAAHPSVGTGFITEDGFFVTARHCVEFWLAYEDELLPNRDDIKSPIVLRAIDAEMDSTIRIVAKLKITSHDGKQTWYFYSDDFTMDKSRDDINDYGDFEDAYLWHSVVSQYEKRDAELGDVAVMRWPYGKGTIKLEKPEVTQSKETHLYSFGYPQNEGRQEAVFSSNEGLVYQDQRTPEECFICEKGFDPGFSGAPVLSRKNGRVSVGIVSRSDGRHTLIVPISQVHHLIQKTEK